MRQADQKHTPGPWGVSGATGRFLVSRLETGDPVALTLGCDPCAFEDARLIASVPDLAASVRDVLDLVDRCHYNAGLRACAAAALDGIAPKMRAALDKAGLAQ